MMRGRLRK